ncbi:aminotransferase class V-fold PLP-dependent enzyme [Pseudomonas guariconensis]|uniref:Nitrogen fixation protein NifS n=1 Tax=Pseudomonas guariconensis TaxID=1288410 RepID=A0AAX0VTG1_9PSED|nr:aminotransferase class V-fold PLP-dependent enzyme [Pseudomonas guariconensis]PLV17837.1 nitrogen fixation protein NifS [Pseudomonas guariconensis]PLV22575.1 nitrogen fixation protein NifS [Pseudomonas guariconensis]PLV27598.1 nitrogen fixation protein NifS [Pseudomonas guariconensis]
MARLDLDFVRNQFPAFAETSLQGQAFFDNAGGSYACKQVIEQLSRYYRETKLQPYGAHPASERAGQEMDFSHAELGRYLGVASEEVHLGPSTSQNTYVLAQAFANRLMPGDEVIVTNQDHEANTGVWRKLAKQGVVVREWCVDAATGSLELSQLKALLSDKTKVVAFPHCSNILGEINPVKEICDIAHAAGAWTVVDGVSYAGHGLPDVQALGTDIYLFSLYKTFGPHLGVMVIRRPLMDYLGNQAHYFNSAHLAKWFVPAGPDHAQVAAASGVIAYLDSVYAHHFSGEAKEQSQAKVRELFRSAEQALLPELLDFCSQDSRVRLLGPATSDQRAATISLQTLNAPPRDISKHLASKGIIAGAGHFYAVRLLEALDVDPDQGVLRLSFVHYTAPAEIQQLITALDECL